MRLYCDTQWSCGFVYAYENQLYNRVKTEGRTKYLKCSTVRCDGSAKIAGDMFFLCACIQSVLFIYFGTKRNDLDLCLQVKTRDPNISRAHNPQEKNGYVI